MYDGFPTSFLTYLPSGEANLAMYDRVEIVRGATGLAQGAGNPGGAINLVRKRARSQLGLSANLSAGSWDMRRADVDITGALNATGSLRGRLVANAVPKLRGTVVSGMSSTNTVSAGRPLRSMSPPRQDSASECSVITGLTAARGGRHACVTWLNLLRL